LADGTVLNTKCVLDARGFEPNENVFLGYQKFVGRTIRTKEPHGLKHPIIMDATVEQLGGYRFVYCLPFTEHEILVEDTYYTDGAELSENEVAARVDDYMNAKGWGDHELLRQEKGVLPITLAIHYPATASDQETLKAETQIGIRGGYYHAVTGYSLPDALREANWIADEMKLGQVNSVAEFLCYSVDEHFQSERFLRLLNRMLFRACEPDQRYKVLQRFYGLNQGLIERFYAGQLTWRDKARILIGKPPVPVHKALYNFSEKAFIKRERKDKARANRDTNK
jgi:lycopene beta-cyclase